LRHSSGKLWGVRRKLLDDPVNIPSNSARLSVQFQDRSFGIKVVLVCQKAVGALRFDTPDTQMLISEMLEVESDNGLGATFYCRG